MLPPTDERVPRSTDEAVNRRIDRETRARIEYFAANPEEIPERLRELEEEWDVERVLEANAAALAFTGTLAALLGRRRWLLLPGFVTAFLFQHAVQGWCPPLPILRRLGFRTAREIERERNALRALRGDFSPIERAQNRLAAVFSVFGFRR
jgi:hypothetical protein